MGANQYQSTNLLLFVLRKQIFQFLAAFLESIRSGGGEEDAVRQRFDDLRRREAVCRHITFTRPTT